MRGYDSKEARAGHRYNMSEKHKRRESEGMKRYWMEKGEGRHEPRESHRDDEVLSHHNKMMYGVDTMSQDYDMGRVEYLKQTQRGDTPEAWDYEY